MRRNLEAEALAQFADAAHEKGLEVFAGQSKKNRLSLGGNNYFQFGDLRVETDARTVVVEAESAGGVTNLVKYWYWIRIHGLGKPLSLIHVFQQNSDQDYVAHLEVWDFLAHRIDNDLGASFSAHRYCYRGVGDLAPALAEFRRLIEGGEVEGS